MRMQLVRGRMRSAHAAHPGWESFHAEQERIRRRHPLSRARRSMGNPHGRVPRRGALAAIAAVALCATTAFAVPRAASAGVLEDLGNAVGSIFAAGGGTHSILSMTSRIS